MHPKAILIKWLKWFGGDTRQAIIGYIVLGLILAGGGLFAISKTALTFLIQIANIPMPLWATTSLIVLCCLYTYVKVVKILSKSDQADQASKSPPYETKYFTIGNYKWEAKIYDNNYFEVDKYPYCVKHDLKFIFRHDSKYCPGTANEKCAYELRDSHFFEAYESAKSIIDNKVRNKTY